MNFKFQILNTRLKSVTALFLFFLISQFAISQNSPALKFQKDSVLIGEPTPVSFVYLHKSKEEVLFADSTFDFAPFEFSKIEIFSTLTRDSISKDSVVYWLSTFEIDKIQTLKLPVFIFTKNDSIPVFSNLDTIILTEVIGNITQESKIIENTDIQNVESEFNYPIFSIVLGGLIVITFLLLIIFRKKIILYFKLKKLDKSNQKFLILFDELQLNFEKNQSQDNLENLIVCWKSQLEKLINQPITKLSTKELIPIIPSKEIIEILRKSDGLIFGNISFENSINQTNTLKAFIETEYLNKIEELKNEGN